MSGIHLLSLERVWKGYGRCQALEDVSISVCHGRVVGLTGPNGSGKSTSLRIAAGLEPPDRGAVYYHGPTADHRTARRCVAYVPDTPAGFEQLTVEEFGQLLAIIHRLDAEERSRWNALLQAFGLADHRKQQLSSLSNGRRRQVAIAAGGAAARSILLIDEATSALDPEACILLREIIRAVTRRGVGVLLATQDLTFVQDVCDEVVVLIDGRTAAVSDVGTLLAQRDTDRLETVFAELVGINSAPKLIEDAFTADR